MPVVIARTTKPRGLFFDRPERREAAGGNDQRAAWRARARSLRVLRQLTHDVTRLPPREQVWLGLLLNQAGP
jgi:hypothetical protein